MKLQKSIIALFVVLVFAAASASAQFGDIMNKVQKKFDKTTRQVDTKTNVSTNGGGKVGGCSAQRQSGPPIGNQPIIEHTPGCPNFIGLSKSPIDASNLKAVQWATEFKSGDPIYGIIFTNGAIGQWAQPGAKNDAQLTINLDAGTEPGDENSYFGGVLATSASIKVTPENQNQTWATFAFIPSPSAQLSGDDIENGYLFLDRIKQIDKPAKLYASVKMIGWSPAPSLAPIVLDLSGGTQSYLAMKGEFNKGMAKVLGADKIMPPAAKMKNPQLENKILAMQNAGRKTQKVLRVIITDGDWSPVRHEVTGVLIGRAITMMVIYKDEEGVCRLEPSTYIEDYNGRTYTGLRLYGFKSEGIIACENVMK